MTDYHDDKSERLVHASDVSHTADQPAAETTFAPAVIQHIPVAVLDVEQASVARLCALFNLMLTSVGSLSIHSHNEPYAERALRGWAGSQGFVLAEKTYARANGDGSFRSVVAARGSMEICVYVGVV
jgi:hypothetical protein